MTQLQKRRAFARLRNLGISQSNQKKEEAGAKNMEKIKGMDDLTRIVHCSICAGSYTQRFFYRHKQTCHTEAKAVKVLAIEEERSSFADLLSRFQNNEVGDLCRKDRSIRDFGRHLWFKDNSKVDKSDEVRKSVMSDMRNVAHLYLLFKIECDDTQSALDMLKQSSWEALKESIVTMTSKSDSNIKYGLKNQLYYLLLRFTDFHIGQMLATEGAEKEVQHMRNFVTLLKHHQNSLFGDAKYQINKSRQENLRLPSRIPPETEIKALRNYTVKRIAEIGSVKTKSTFVELRNLVCSRLTLFNARRGGEPSRLKMDNWNDRDKWIPEDLSAQEKEYFSDMSIMYGTGKGNHLVSTIGEQYKLQIR